MRRQLRGVLDVGWCISAAALARACSRAQRPAMGTSVRVGDLGGPGSMATSTTVDATMMVATLMAMMAKATARPVTAPMLITPTTVTWPSRRR
eukprot:1572704-Pyramimonas_sp.AAC.1